MIGAALRGIPETLPVHRRGGSGLRQSARRMVDLAGDWSYLRHVAVLALATAGTFTYVGGSSFVLEAVYGLTASQFAVVFAVNAGAMAASSWLFRVLVGRVAVPALRLAGLTTAALAAVALAVAASALREPAPPLALVWAALFVVNAGIGWVAPASMALAVEAGARARGAASALLGGLPFFVGALATPLTGVVGYGSVLPLGLLMATFLSASLVLLLSSTRGGDDGSA